MSIYNKTAIRDLMEEPPKGQRLWDAFGGDWDKLTDDQILDLKAIVDKEYSDFLTVINRVIYARNIG